MIRRNYIQTVIPMAGMERKSYQSKGKLPKEDKYAKYNYKKDPDSLLAQQSKWAVPTSNKKYHQYKDWKDQKSKPEPVQPLSNRKVKQPLTQFTSNDQQTLLSRYKRDHECQIEQMFKKECVNGRNSAARPRKSVDSNPLTYNYLKNAQKDNSQIEEQRPPRRESLNLHKYNFQRGVESPPKQKNVFQSTRKYSLNVNNQNPLIRYEQSSSKYQPKSFTPHFQPAKQPRREQTSSFDLPKPPAGRIADYRQLMRDQRQQKRQNYNSDRIPNPRRMPEYPSFRDQSMGSSLTVGEERSIDDKVADKLKMISNFNDQINDRIKNIIVCFQELKSKI